MKGSPIPRCWPSAPPGLSFEGFWCVVRTFTSRFERQTRTMSACSSSVSVSAASARAPSSEAVVAWIASPSLQLS